MSEKIRRESPIYLDPEIFKKIKIDEFSGAKVNFSLNESWERKSESEKNLKQTESEKDDLSGKFLNKTEIKESRNLYKILHKIQNNESCKNFEKFIRKYYLSKKQSYITILRKNIEELYNFNDEYLRPLSKYSIKNIYDNSVISLTFEKKNNYSNLSFLHHENIQELEISIKDNWKTAIIHGIEKMMLAQNYSNNYMNSDPIINFYMGIKSNYDNKISNISELIGLEENFKIICTFEKIDNILDIIINISISFLIPHLSKTQSHFYFNKVKKVEFKFEDVDTILVTHKKMDYKMPTNLKINMCGHGCLHEVKSLKNFLTKLDKESVFKTQKKPYNLNEFICDEEPWSKNDTSRFSKKLNKITKFHLYQFSRVSFQKMDRINYFMEIEVQNHKSDYRLLMNLMKGLTNLQNIFLITFNINLVENQKNDFYEYLEKNKSLWLNNKYLISIKVNGNCESFTQATKYEFKNLINRKRVAFLQGCAIENLRHSKIMKFRKEICQEILNYLI